MLMSSKLVLHNQKCFTNIILNKFKENLKSFIEFQVSIRGSIVPPVPV